MVLDFNRRARRRGEKAPAIAVCEKVESGRLTGANGGREKKEESLFSLFAPVQFFLARKHAVVTPVIDETYAMLYEGKDIRQAVRDLMARELKAED